MRFRIVIAFIATISFAKVYAQDDSLIFNKNKWIEYIETAFEENETSADYIPSIENLEYLAKYPININKATVEELRSTTVFTDQEILLIKKYIDTYGGLVEKEELYAIPGIKPQRVPFLMNFFEVKEYKVDQKMKFKEGNHLIISRYTRVLDEQKGFTNGNFQGDQWQHYFRYNYKLDKRLGAGFTLERDPGEPINEGINQASVRRPYGGFDFFSGHLYYRPANSFVQAVHVGDYGLAFGQGLTFWNDFASSKTAYAVSVKRSGPELLPYRSVNEWNYLRGGAVKLGNPNLNGIVFYSSKFRDASTSTDSLGSLEIITNNLQTSGLHRTISEQNNKNSIHERIVGGRLSYQKSRFHVGMTHSYTKYSRPLQQSDEIYNEFDFSGTELHNTSIDYKYISTHVELYGENTFTSFGEHAHLNGLHFTATENLVFNLSHRYYSRGYLSPYAQAFGESSNTTNESGIYLGMDLILTPKWNILAYYDLYRFPWSSFSSIAPVDGYDYLVQLNYQVNGDMDMYVRLKDETKETNTASDGRGLKDVTTNRNTRFRYHLNYKPIWFVNLKTRLEVVRFQDEVGVSYGRMLYQDVQYKFPFFRGKPKNKYPLALTTRIAFIDNESFDSRIFAYENDVLYSYSIRSYDLIGMRYYVMLKYNFTKKLRFWVRYSRSTKTEEDTFGSGNTFIDKPSRSDIRLQLMYEF